MNFTAFFKITFRDCDVGQLPTWGWEMGGISKYGGGPGRGHVHPNCPGDGRYPSPTMMTLGLIQVFVFTPVGLPMWLIFYFYFNSSIDSLLTPILTPILTPVINSVLTPVLALTIFLLQNLKKNVLNTKYIN